MDHLENNKKITNDIVLVIFFVAALTFAIIYLTTDMMKKRGFTELYFNNIAEIPNEILINSKNELSFTIISHELEAYEYKYNINCDNKNITNIVKLIPEKNVTINFSISPKTKNWVLIQSNEKNIKKIIDVNNYTILGSKTNNTSYYPISIPIDGYLGEIFVNVSLNELQKKEYTQINQYYEELDNKTYYKNETITLLSKENKIYIHNNIIEKIYEINESICEITLYTPNEKQKIHFWYTVKDDLIENK